MGFWKGLKEAVTATADFVTDTYEMHQFNKEMDRRTQEERRARDQRIAIKKEAERIANLTPREYTQEILDKLAKKWSANYDIELKLLTTQVKVGAWYNGYYDWNYYNSDNILDMSEQELRKALYPIAEETAKSAIEARLRADGYE